MHVQIVNFKLKADTSREAFLELTAQMIAWLKNREGFIAYELYEGSEYWSDRIAWECEKHAKEGLNHFLTTATAMRMVPLVEIGYTTFFGELVASA